MAYKVLHQWALPEILIQPVSGLKGGPAGLLLESEGKSATWGIGLAVEVCELIIVHLCSFSLFLATPGQSSHASFLSECFMTKASLSMSSPEAWGSQVFTSLSFSPIRELPIWVDLSWCCTGPALVSSHVC